MPIEPRDESNDIHLFLASLPAFASFSASELSEVEKCSTVVARERGEELFEGGGEECVYAVVSGVLEFRGMARSESTPDQLVSGNLFVRSALGLRMPRGVKAVARERSHILRMPVARMEHLLLKRPPVRDAIASEAARHLVRMHLSTMHMFTDLDDVLFSSVAERCEFLMVKRGELVIREGDKAECLFIVAFGALEVFRELPDGKRRAVEILHDGACVGEMALLLNEPRSVSVRARRDSLLVRVPAECFEHVLQKNGRLTLGLVRTLGERLRRTTTAPDRDVPLKTISIVPLTAEPRFREFCEGLREAFHGTGEKIAFLRASDLEARANETASILNSVDDRFRGWLADQESEHDFVLFECERGNSGWTERCNRQADLILLVCMPDRDELSEEMRRRIQSHQSNEAAVELVLLRGSQAPPKNTGAWLECGRFERHHQILWNDKQDYARLTRRVQGKSWGLVLGGGGARGLSHIGTIQALRENGMPIDWVAGTSMGAIIAAQVAMGLSTDEMIRATKEAYGGSSFSTDYTFPFVSMRTGRSTVRILQRLFGERQIEDLPINYFCVSCNLSRAEIVVHERGPVWLWTRVSCSVPGLLPPVPYQGDLLVDGGLLENLPVEIMRHRCGGYVAAADVSVAADLLVSNDLKPEANSSGSAHLLRKWRGRPTLPDIFRIMLRTAEVGSVRQSRTSGSPADLYLHPPLDLIAMTDFAAIDRIIAIGYEYAIRNSKHWNTLHAAGSA